MIDISQGEIQSTSIQPNDSSKKRGWERLGPPILPPTPQKCYFLSIYLYVYTTLSLYLSSIDYLNMSRSNPSFLIANFTKCLANWFFKMVGWGKTRPAHSFPLHYFLTFQFICQSFGLNSYTVSEHSLWTHPKEKFKLTSI